MRKYRWDKKYLYWGVTAFCVVAAAIVFYMLINHLRPVRLAMHQLGSILSPFIWGLIIAYLLHPLSKFYQRYLFQPLAKRLLRRSKKAETAVPKLARGLAVVLAIISLLVVLVGMMWMVVPQIYSSIETLVVNGQRYVEIADGYIARLLENYPEIEAMVSETFGDISSGLTTLATDQLLPRLETIITNLTSSVYYFGKGIYNILVGIIVSIYVLYSRETYSANCKKILYAVFSLEAAEKILDGLHFTNRVFIGFLSGKILDSMIIGVLCYIGCSALQIEYAMLASVCVGVTNVIPFFGPIFGAIFPTFIILMESPMHALVFVIFVLLLQQFDGNFLGPKILGNSVGINGFWVMFAIILGAGLFGFTGMLLGVPVCVVILTLIKNMVNKKLVRSGLPTDTEAYKDLDHVDPVTGAFVDFQTAPARPGIRKKSRFAFWRKKKEAAQSAASKQPEPDTTTEEDPQR